MVDVKKILLVGMLLSFLPFVYAVDHPYMFLNDQTIDDVRFKFNAPENAVFKQKILELANSPISYPPMPADTFLDDPNIRNIEQYILAHAFLYLMTGDTQERDKAIEYMMQTTTYESWLHAQRNSVGTPLPPYNDLARSHLARGVAVAYDWLYNDMTEVQRATIRQRLLYETGYYHSSQTNGLGEHGNLYIWTVPSAYKWDVKNPWQNHGWHALSAMAVTGYALRNEAPESQAMIDFSMAKFEEWLSIQPTDGSWSEGLSYAFYGLEPYAYASYLAHELDQRPYPHSELLLNITTFLSHMTVPGDLRVYPYADLSGTIPADTTHSVLSVLSIEYSQPVAEWYYDEYLTAIGSWTMKPQYLLMHTDSPAVPPSTLPLTGVYPDLGIVTSRQSWTDPQSSWFAFKSGWYGGLNANLRHGGMYLMNNGHDHRDNNNVVFWKNGEFILSDPQNYNCAHPHIEGAVVKCRNAWAHNLPVFDNFDMVYERSLENAQGLALFQEYVTGDNVLVVDDRGDYIFATGDSHLLYDPLAGVQKFRRSVVYIDDTLVIFDKIILDTTRRIDWNFHSDIAPVLISQGVRFTSGSNDFTLSLLHPEEYQSRVLDSHVNISKQGSDAIFVGVLHPTNQPVIISESNNLVRLELSSLRTFYFDMNGALVQFCPEVDFTNDCAVTSADWHYVSTHDWSLRELVLIGRKL